jgi:hypothetical protein
VEHVEYYDKWMSSGRVILFTDAENGIRGFRHVAGGPAGELAMYAMIPLSRRDVSLALDSIGTVRGTDFGLDEVSARYFLDVLASVLSVSENAELESSAVIVFVEPIAGSPSIEDYQDEESKRRGRKLIESALADSFLRRDG